MQKTSRAPHLNSFANDTNALAFSIYNKQQHEQFLHLNGHLKYPNYFDQSLNDAATDKVRKYRVDYNNRTPSAVSFIPSIPSTSDRLHSEFVRLLFLQDHRETDLFFTVSGVLSTQSDCGFYHLRHADVSVQLKRKVGLTLVTAVLRIT